MNATDMGRAYVDCLITICYSLTVMLMMRLQRVGRRNNPSYRVVVTDKRTGPKSNKHVAVLGSYSPQRDHVQLDAAAVEKWLGNGVQPSPTVHNILVGQGLVKGKKVNVLPKKSPIIDEAAEAARREEEEAAAVAAASDTAEPAPDAEDAPAEEVAETATSEDAPAAEAVDTEEETEKTAA